MLCFKPFGGTSHQMSLFGGQWHHLFVGPNKLIELAISSLEDLPRNGATNRTKGWRVHRMGFASFLPRLVHSFGQQVWAGSRFLTRGVPPNSALDCQCIYQALYLWYVFQCQMIWYNNISKHTGRLHGMGIFSPFPLEWFADFFLLSCRYTRSTPQPVTVTMGKTWHVD